MTDLTLNEYRGCEKEEIEMALQREARIILGVQAPEDKGRVKADGLSNSCCPLEEFTSHT